MAETTGTVTYVKVNKEASAGGDFGFFGLQPSDGSSEMLFIIWWTITERETATVVDWIARNMHVAMLRDALVQRLNVIVFHDDDPTSHTYRSLQVQAP